MKQAHLWVVEEMSHDSISLLHSDGESSEDDLSGGER
jgi:hypothetical protein